MQYDVAVYLSEIARSSLLVVAEKNAEQVDHSNRELIYFATADGRRAGFGDGGMAIYPDLHPTTFQGFLAENLIAPCRSEDATGRTFYRLTPAGCLASIAASLQLMQ